MKRKILSISDKMLVALFTKGKHFYDVVYDGLPEDSKIVDCKMRIFAPVEGYGTIDLLIESECFNDVGEGKQHPFICPTIKTDEKIIKTELLDRIKLLGDKYEERWGNSTDKLDQYTMAGIKMGLGLTKESIEKLYND